MILHRSYFWIQGNRLSQGTRPSPANEAPICTRQTKNVNEPKNRPVGLHLLVLRRLQPCLLAGEWFSVIPLFCGQTIEGRRMQSFHLRLSIRLSISTSSSSGVRRARVLLGCGGFCLSWPRTPLSSVGSLPETYYAGYP